MTTLTDIVNIALQYLGTRTTITDVQLATNSKNEAIQANLILTKLRDQTLRMAPWNCALNTANLTYITSVPGTPENTSPATSLWAKGQPPPPWGYEYQYPVDCLRPCWIIPAQLTGVASGVPITTAVTGWSPSTSLGGPIVYKVQVDQFVPVTAAAVVAGGTRYAIGDIITLASGLSTNPPIGAPAQLLVLTAPGGVVGTVSVVPQVFDSNPAAGGSYFAQQTNPVAQGSTTGSGSGATFNLTYGAKSDQRVFLTNQEFATLAYVKRVLDPNTMDELFVDAWSAILGARLCMSLTGDKALANVARQAANAAVAEARKADGNEGLTINDVTPDWIRIRGITSYDNVMGYSSGFDWGPFWGAF